MALGDVWEVTDIQNVSGTRLSNVFYYRQETSSTDDEARTRLAAAYLANVSAAMVLGLSSEWQSICREIKKVGVTGQQFWRDPTASAIGTQGASLNPATVATIATFTATAGRNGTGRAYISGIAQADEQRNNLTLEGLGRMNVIGLALIAPITDTGSTFTPGRAAGTIKNPAPPPDTLPTLFDPWVLADERVVLTKLRSRRASTRC